VKNYSRRLKHILRSRYIFKILFIICIIYIFLFIKFDNKISIYKINQTEFIGIVTNYKYKDGKYTIYIKNKENLIVNYKTDVNLNIEYGDTLKIIGSLSVPSNNTIPNLFNYKKYLYRKNIHYILNAQEIKKIKNNENIIYDIKNRLIKRINKIKKSSYIMAFVLGNKNELEETVNKSYQDNGISHLFAISGMHISLFSGLLYFLVKKISYNNYYNFIVVLSFLIFYMVVLDYPISVVRTIVMFSIFKINKLLNLHISKLDLMLIVFIILTIINPYVIYEVSFQFSYIISFYLVIFNKQINNSKHKKLYMSFVCFIVSFPIVIYNYYQISLISIFINLFFIPYVSIIVFPLSIITLIFPFLDNILYIFIYLLETISLNISNIDILKISFIKPSIYLIIFYYIIITLSMYNKKYLYVLLFTILIHKNYIYFDKKIYITYLDVSQGDSTLITYKNKTILIDTGGSYYSKNISLNRTIPYLKSIGRNKIDYLIITHGDYDHMGEAINLVNNFKAKKVIFNCGDFNELEQDLIKVLDKKKIPYYSCIKELNIDNNKLYFLNNKDHRNENDNSSVIYTELNNHKFLFMGDAGVEVEEDLTEKYNLKDIDVLKVGHHGSKTSSSEEFINQISPKYSIISVGKSNWYGHPNKEVLDNLNESKIYRTDEDGSIMFKIKNNKLKIETCSP